jgi:hypothetical protein
MSSNNLRTRRACDVCQKHTWFVGENCEVCLKKKKNQIMIALILIVVIAFAALASLRYFPSDTDQTYKPTEIAREKVIVAFPDSSGGFSSMLGGSYVSDNVGQNPFRLYQRVYPNAEFYKYELGIYESNLISVARSGAIVIDQTNAFLRLLFDDGTVSTYPNRMFTGKTDDLDRNSENYEFWIYNNWRLGNPFAEGDVVCAVPDSAWIDIPDKSIVLKVDEQFVYIVGDESTIEFSHFQYCK